MHECPHAFLSLVNLVQDRQLVLLLLYVFIFFIPQIFMRAGWIIRRSVMICLLVPGLGVLDLVSFFGFRVLWVFARSLLFLITLLGICQFIIIVILIQIMIVASHFV